uniref:ATP synthase subunit a n=1 Tax=Plaxiphora albida TaxID=256106 RepID=A0A6H1PFV9_PLAAB|nr:ATP synthase F0 subunit 6 [Plaxiphora albida]
MMMDIFSSFDDQNFTIFSFSPLIWILSLLPLILVQTSYWISSSRWSNAILFPKSFMTLQITRTTGKNISGFTIALVSMFCMLIFINLMGLFPYVFSMTSHLTFAFSFGLPLWLSLIISGLFFNFSEVISHFLPSGAPSILNPFLVLVETVSISVRPLTLSIRLAANMSAGHIILGLIGSYLSISFFCFSLFIIFILTMIQIFYFVFEVGIALIQAYIFSLLISLYSDDHPK